MLTSADTFFSGFFNITNNVIEIDLQPFQLDYLQEAYDRLMESTYANLVLQTRLKPYLDAIETILDDKGLHYDATPGQLHEAFPPPELST